MFLPSCERPSCTQKALDKIIIIIIIIIIYYYTVQSKKLFSFTLIEIFITSTSVSNKR